MKDLKVLFMGTPEFSVPILEMLIEYTNVIMVVTQKDALVGRKKELKPSPIKELALKNNIEVFTPEKIKNDYEKIIGVNPDIIINCAYGQIIPKILLDLPKYGCINVHASLLPKLRGGAPIHHAIINGYAKTGVTIMYMDEKMDNGDIISSKEYIIKDNDNVGDLHDFLSIIGRDLLLETLPSIINGTNKRIKQNEKEVTFAYTIKREDELLNFNDISKNIYNKIRGLYPWPLAYVILNNEEVKVLKCNIIKDNSNFNPGEIINITKNEIIVKTKDGAIGITSVKPFGKKEMNVTDYLNGIKDKTSLKLKNNV